MFLPAELTFLVSVLESLGDSSSRFAAQFREKKMGQATVDAIYAEYPFVDKYFPRGVVNNVQLSIWTGSFFNCTQSRRLRLEYMEDPLYLLDSRGKAVAIVGEDTRFSRKLFEALSGSKPELFDENVSQTLYRIGTKAQLVKYAVTIHRPLPGYGDPCLILYVLPHEFNNAAEFYASIVNAERVKLTCKTD